jgi:hypothetical protein
MQPTVVDVLGTLNLSAAVGLEAVVAALVREREVVIDLSHADEIDSHGWRTVTWAIGEIRGHGGDASVRLPMMEAVR